MSFVSDLWDNTVGAAWHTVEKIGKSAGNFIDKVFTTAGKTIENIAKDPLPTILTVVAASYGVPVYVSAATITAARGGTADQILKSAAVSYAASSALQNTAYGQTVTGAAQGVGVDVTHSLISNAGLSIETAGAIGTGVAQGLTSSLAGGAVALLQGKDVATGLATGFAAGAIQGGVESYFNSLNETSWGLSDKALKAASGATTVALTAMVTGKDMPTALGIYLGNSLLRLGTSEAKTAFTDSAKKAEDTRAEAKQLETDNSYVIQARESQLKQLQAQADQQNKWVDSYNNGWYYNYLRNNLDLYTTQAYKYATSSAAEYQATYDKYMATYDEYSAAVDTYNATRGSNVNDVNRLQNEVAQLGYDLNFQAEQAQQWGSIYTTTMKDLAAGKNPYATELQKASDQLAANNADLQTRLEDLNNPQSTNWITQEYVAYQNKQKALADQYGQYVRDAQNAQVAYQTQVTEVALRDVFVDSIKSGAITPVSSDNGVLTFSNGMTYDTKAGTFMQDGQELFATAKGVDYGTDWGFKVPGSDAVYKFNNNGGFTVDGKDPTAPETATANTPTAMDADQQTTFNKLNYYYGGDGSVENVYNQLVAQGNSPQGAQAYVQALADAFTLENGLPRVTVPDYAGLNYAAQTPVEPEPTPVEPEPTPVEPEPTPVEPEPTPVEPEPTPVEPEPTPVEPEPTPVEPTPVEPEPTPVEPEPTPVEPEPTPEQPSGIQVADAGTGTTSDAGEAPYTVPVGGVPVYADTQGADKVTPPFGYDLMPMSMADNKPEGAYYDETQNAWFMPNKDAEQLQQDLATLEPTPVEPETPVINDPTDLANTDWNAIYGTTPEDQAKYPVQDLGVTDAAMEEYQKNLQDIWDQGGFTSQWKPTEAGGHTLTDDSGSTITLDNTGKIVGYTEAAPGALLQDWKAQQAAVTKPTPTPTPTVNQPSTTVNVAKPAATQSSGTNIAALLATLAAMNGSTTQQPPQTGPQLVDIGQQLDLGAPLETNPFAKPQTQTKMAQGGSIDDLLALLRRG